MALFARIQLVRSASLVFVMISRACTSCPARFFAFSALAKLAASTMCSGASPHAETLYREPAIRYHEGVSIIRVNDSWSAEVAYLRIEERVTRPVEHRRIGSAGGCHRYVRGYLPLLPKDPSCN